MRVLAMAVVTIAAVAAISPAQAQTYDPRYPVCLQIYQGWNDSYFECGYTSLAQCNMSHRGAPRSASSTRITQAEKPGGTGGSASSIDRSERRPDTGGSKPRRALPIK